MIQEPTYTKIGGIFHLVHERGGKVIAEYSVPNGVTSQGLGALWRSGVGIPINGSNSQWYLGLLRRTGINPALVWGNTWGTVAGGGARWTPMSTELGWGGLLDPITFDAASGGTISTSVVLQTVLASTVGPAPVVEGLFITNVGTTSITSGILWCTAPTTKTTVTSGDLLTISYTLSTSIGTEGQ